MPNLLSSRLPTQESYNQLIDTLVWDQFPAVVEKSYSAFMHVPYTGPYAAIVKKGVESFDEALLTNTQLQYTISGTGSLFDYDTFGHVIQRPTPQLLGTGCNANSLCIEPTCFGFTEAVVESNNTMHDMCWEIGIPCMKDYRYSDREFIPKIKSYIKTFMRQPTAVSQAYIRTRLLRESIKIVATDESFEYTGLVAPGAGIPLPFYIDPTDPTGFPAMDNVAANVGGLNLEAVINYLIPSLFSGYMTQSQQGYYIFGLQEDYNVAMYQTMEASDKFLYAEMMKKMNMSSRDTYNLDSRLGDFMQDPVFPRFELDSTQSNLIVPISYDQLNDAALEGRILGPNPKHGVAKLRGLMLVPHNWRFSLVEPPQDDFSGIGLGGSLNFLQNTPGVEPLYSSSMYKNYSKNSGETIYIGKREADSMGRAYRKTRGLSRRPLPLQEAIRTIITQTYTDKSSNDSIDGQMPTVGACAANQKLADGFMMKSTMYISSRVEDTPKPILLIFEADQPRVAQPIRTCTVNTVEVTAGSTMYISDCCVSANGGVTLTFTGTDAQVADAYSAEDTALYRTGARGSSYLVTVASVSGNLVTIAPVGQGVTLPCCTGSPDDYG